MLLPPPPGFLDKKVGIYQDLHKIRDSVYRKLQSDGVGMNVKHCEPFSREEETTLWKSGVLSISNPKCLQRAIFYYVGKHFCIRGGEEQRSLKPSQFVRSSNPDSYTYVEHGSKNRPGGIDQMNLENKCVKCVAIPENRPMCLVYLLDLYLKKLPSFAFEKEIFYCRPKATTPHSDKPWYDSVAVGKNKLAGMVSEMCEAGGVKRRTNHSLRATGASALFQGNVPEKVIQQTTGHRSVEALRVYERPSDDQQRKVSKLMMNSKKESTKTKYKEMKVDGLFDLNGCNIGKIVQARSEDDESDDEFDKLASVMDLDLH